MMTMRKQRDLIRTRIWGDTRGQELLELAFVFPLLLTLLFGIFWFARAFETYESMVRAAREGARVALAPSCSACGSPGTLPGIGTVGTAIQNALQAASLNSAKVGGSCPTLNGANASCSCSGSAPKFCLGQNWLISNSGSTPQELGVLVTFNYPFTFTLPFTPVSLTTITLSTKVQMREEDQ